MQPIHNLSISVSGSVNTPLGKAGSCENLIQFYQESIKHIISTLYLQHVLSELQTNIETISLECSGRE